MRTEFHNGSTNKTVAANGGTALHSPIYHLMPADLRQPPMAVLTPVLANVEAPLLNIELPTLLLFECVLVYMQPAASTSIVAWFKHYFGNGDGGPLGGIVYEMFGLDDAFGKVMKSNMKVTICGYLRRTAIDAPLDTKRRLARGRSVLFVVLPAAEVPGAWVLRCSSSDAERDQEGVHRQSRVGEVRPSKFAYQTFSHHSRISHLEMLDEVEELELVLEHYAVTWGVKIPCAQIDGTTGSDRWLEWGLKRSADD